MNCATQIAAWRSFFENKFMRTNLLLLLAAFLFSFTSGAQNSQLAQLLEKHGLKGIANQQFAKVALSKADCETVYPFLIEAWQNEVYQRLHEDAEQLCLRRGDLKLRFAGHDFGECPEDGYSLYISLHGGGSAPHQVNDQQWMNQINLYHPAEGFYIAPRAPWDDWNMWFKPGFDEFLEDLIQWMVVANEVNPNRVYLMGYSAGGDGVWRMAPRMADRWAAASMMAGHPGEAQQVNLLNVPFMIWMGENDAAYNRNVLAREKGLVMDSLANVEPLNYIHETHIVPGKGHWMEQADTVAVDWMANFEREPLPSHVVWRQEDVVRSNLYWLEVDKVLARPGMRVDAEITDNTIQILRCDYDQLRIYLNDEMVNLDQPVSVVYRGRTLYKGKPRRTMANMARTLAERGDYNWIFPSYVDIKIK